MAIITFRRGAVGSNWKVEYRTTNRATWINDDVAPFQPTPSPPDSSVAAGHIHIGVDTPLPAPVSSALSTGGRAG